MAEVKLKVSLQDDVTGKASGVSAALGKVEQSIQATQRAAAGAKIAVPQITSGGKAPGAGAAQAIAGAKIDPGPANELSSALTLSHVKALLLVDAVRLIGSTVSSVVGSVWNFTKSLVEASIQSAIAKDTLLFTMGKFMGGTEKATAELKKLKQTALELGAKTGDLTSNFQKLIKTGASPELAQNLVKMTADLGALGNGAEDAAAATDMIARAMAMGKFEGRQFRQLMLSLPGGTEAFAKKLSEITKKKIDPANFDVGDFSMGDTMLALRATLRDIPGGFKNGGIAAERSFTTIGGALDVLDARFGDLKGAIGTALIPVLRDNVLPWVKKVAEFAGSEKGQAAIQGIAKAFGQLADAVMKGVAALFGFKPDDLTPGMDGMAQAAGKVADGIKGIADAVAPTIEKLRQMVSLLDQINPESARRDQARDLTLGGDTLTRGAGQTQAIARKAGMDIGQALSDGIAAGTISAQNAPIAAAQSVVLQATAAARAIGQIHSPSQLMAKSVGEPLAQGVAVGIDSGQPRVDSAMAGMIDPKRVGAGRAGAGGAGMGNMTANVTLTVQGANDPQATAEAVQEVLASKLVGEFQRMALQLGAA